MKRILGFVGSPRRNGNTDLLVSRILEGARSKGAVTETVFLSDLVIRECDGCHVCWKGEQCPRKDDMNSLYPRIAAADAIVFGTPVYWYGPTALMKGLVDRLVYFNCPENRVKIRNKKAIVAIPYEDEEPQTAELVVSFFEKCFDYLEMDLVGQVVVGGVSNRGDVLRKPASLAAAHDLGQQAVDDIT